MEAVYIDHMGDDLRVANAARVSFDKESEWEIEHHRHPNGDLISTKECLTKADQRLIKYLAKHNHWTPFSHIQITMRERVPIFVARQRFKHMVGFTYNEVSRRYVDSPPEFYTPDDWRCKPTGNIKQGSGTDVITEAQFEILLEGDSYALATRPISKAVENHHRASKVLYNDLISAGIAPEQARMVLPQSMYTEYYCTGSLAAWARAYILRTDSHAQREIQTLAHRWDEIIRGIKGLEHSWAALTTENL